MDITPAAAMPDTSRPDAARPDAARPVAKSAASAVTAAAQLQFRAATHADLPAVVALVESAYRGDASRAGWTTEADFLGGQRTSLADITPLLDRPTSRILLVEGEGSLLACAHVAVEDGTGYFGMFSVDPQRQGSGTGSQVLAEAERLVREEWACPGMRMTVIDIRDALIAYYERRGYRRTGVHKPVPSGDARFGLPLRDDLRFEVLEKIFGDAA
ncbi:MAG: GNAT family N-acetyltransferase [Luteimonas sp.]